MAERAITVRIIGDPASLERAFAKSSASARHFQGQVSTSSRSAEKELSRIERGALAGSGAFGHLGRSVAFASTAFLGAAGFVEVLKSSIDVVLNSQASIALLDTAIKNAHASVKALTPILEAHAAAARKLGFDDDQTREAEAKLVTAFGATKKSLDELKVAEDLARSTHTDLGAATRQLILLQEGNTRAAKQFGLALPDLTKKQWEAKAAADGLNVAQEKGKTLYDQLLPRIKDQAKAYADSPAGKIAEFHAEIQHLQESIGTGLLPIVDKYLTKVDDWLAKGKNQKRVTDDVKKVVDELATVLGDVKNAVKDVIKFSDPFVKEIGGWTTVVEGLIALKFATVIAGWTTQVGKLTTAMRILGKVPLPKWLGPLGLAGGALAVATGVVDVAGRTQQNFVGKGGQELIRQSNGQWFISAGRGGLVPISAAQAKKILPAGSTAAGGGTPGGADRYPGVQGPGGGMMWSGDHGGLDRGFKSKLAACVADAGGTAVDVSSGRRSKDRNNAVGGAPNSNHLTGHAADGTCTINGVKYPLGNAPMNYSKFGLRAGSTFNWGGGPDIYHVDDGTNVGGASSSTSPYGPSQTSGTSSGGGSSSTAKKPKWVGATAATITTLTGSITAELHGLPAVLDPVEKNAVAHIKALEGKLRIHMSAAELAKDKVELKKWGKTLHDEVTQNAKVAAAAAAEAKQKLQRALALDVSHILRDFDRQFGAVKAKFDKETAAGLAARAAPTQTPEERALADFIAQRASVAAAAADAQRQSDLAAAIATGDPVQIQQAQDAISQALLDSQQQALQAAADLSRTAADQKAADAQQAYQDQRDAAWQSLQDINDDQRTALQNNLEDWTSWIEAKKKTWSAFVQWLQANGFDTSGLINTDTGAPQGSTGNSYQGQAPVRGRAVALAGGGIVTKPTLALVGEAGREAIIPLDSGGISSSTPTVEIHFHGGTFIGSRPEQVARELKPHLDRVIQAKR